LDGISVNGLFEAGHNTIVQHQQRHGYPHTDGDQKRSAALSPDIPPGKAQE
jgi:hypothetical protein